jgi:hypothetical protein
MPDEGIVYVATQKLAYVCEAIASAETARASCPELPIVLFTDRADVLERSSGPFDAVLPVEDVGAESGPQLSWGDGLQQRVACLARSPFARTLHLDTDTRVLSGDLRQIFRELDRYSIAMVPCRPGKSRGFDLYGPMFNCGVIAWRKDLETDNLLGLWAQLQRFHMMLAALEPPGVLPYLAHLDDADRRFMLTNDQTSLARFLSPDRNEFGIAVKVLGDQWNARNPPRDGLDGVIIDHSDCHKVAPTDAERLLSEAGFG